MTTHNEVIDRAATGAPGTTDDRLWSDPEAWRATGEGEWRAESRGAGLARALGFVSLGLGITHLVAPRALGRLTGVGERPELMRGMGARELASGVGILANERPASWVWARVVGDVMDLALLSRALGRPDGDRKRVIGTAAAVTGALVLDAYCALQLSRERRREGTEPREIQPAPSRSAESRANA